MYLRNSFFFNAQKTFGGGGINVQDSDIVASEFELQLRHYVHIWTNILGKA